MQLVPHTPDSSVPNAIEGALAAALAAAVCTPVDALRIVLEDIARGTTSGSALPTAADSLERVSRNVRAIENYYLPIGCQPLRCTLPEIMGGVRSSLASVPEERLALSLDPALDPELQLLVDGPLLIASLVRLIDNGLEACDGSVTLHMSGPANPLKPESRIAHVCTFTIDDDGSTPFDFRDMVRPFRSRKRGHVGLGMTLADRDITRLGGLLTREAKPHGGTRFIVELDDSCSAKEAA